MTVLWLKTLFHGLHCSRTLLQAPSVLVQTPLSSHRVLRQQGADEEVPRCVQLDANQTSVEALHAARKTGRYPGMKRHRK